VTYPTAKGAEIVREGPREAILNVLVEGEEVKRFRLNKAQLHQINTQSADILMKDFQ
jgi:hypothetical protein